MFVERKLFTVKLYLLLDLALTVRTSPNYNHELLVLMARLWPTKLPSKSARPHQLTMEESRYWQQWPGTGGDADEQNDDELQGWALQDGAIDGLAHRLEDIHFGRTLSAAAAAGDKNEAFIVAVFEADLDSVRLLHSRQ